MYPPSATLSFQVPQLPCGSWRGGHRVGLGQLQFGSCHLGHTAALPEPWVFCGLHDNGLGNSFPILFSIKAQNQCWGGRRTFTPLSSPLPFLDPLSTQFHPSVNPFLERTHQGHHQPDPKSKRGLNQHSLLQTESPAVQPQWGDSMPEG